MGRIVIVMTETFTLAKYIAGSADQVHLKYEDVDGDEAFIPLARIIRIVLTAINDGMIWKIYYSV